MELVRCVHIIKQLVFVVVDICRNVDVYQFAHLFLQTVFATSILLIQGKLKLEKEK